MIDSSTLYLLSGKFIIGLLFFVRLSGVFVSGPFFNNEAIVPQMKVLLAVIIASSLTAIYWDKQPQIDFHLWNMVLLVLKEFFVGAAIGFSANIVFWGARFAGGLIDFDMGYQAATMFNINEESPTLVGEFMDMVTLMVFLVINGHHYLLEGIYASVKAVPISTFQITGSTVQILIRVAVSVFIIGVKMAAPVLVALFLSNLALSLLARIAPQTNIFILSFQLKIVVGLLVLLASSGLFVLVAKYSLQALESEIMKIIISMNPARV